MPATKLQTAKLNRPAAKARERSELPRRPERANGVARYERLIEATERIIEKAGVAEVTIQAVAAAARVPMASVYHFFPSAMAACLGVAEKHQAQMADIVAHPIEHSPAQTLEDYIEDISERTRRYYSKHPVAMRLILGSECTWAVREADIMQNRMLAKIIAAELQRRFGVAGGARLQRTIALAIATLDAIWSVSIAEHGKITDAYAAEARKAASAYLRAAIVGLD
jgi:AcrR family transcriptional regulator